MLKGAIFDFDGTLVDSMFIWETFGEDYLRSLGKEPKENLREIFATFTLEQAAEYYRQHYGVTLSVEEIVSGINEMVLQSYRRKVKLKSGVAEFLEKLKNQDVKMCVATVTDRFVVEEVLEGLGVRKYFSEIFTCSEIGCNKEKPDIYNKALEHLKTEKSETVVFEDAYYALMTAKNDGFIVAGVFDKHEKNQVQIKANADYYITDYARFDFTEQIKTALTIAGSDSSGGAGIQADIKTMTMNGVYAMSAITALTAQNTTGVTSIMEVTPQFLEEQIVANVTDIFPDSVKTGMVASSSLIKVIADSIKKFNLNNIVVDPVMVATSGAKLIADDAIISLKKELLPLATIITPNIPEAEVLSEIKIHNSSDMEKAAKIIFEKFGCSVLLKGGHNLNDANDFLLTSTDEVWFSGKRIDNPNTHGTGCTLSSAIASNLAKGFSIKESVQNAKTYISGALSAMLDLGKGSGPLNHAFIFENK